MLQPSATCARSIPLRTAHAATGCTLLRCRATGCIRFNPSEAKAPLAESCGVCAVLWTRICFDVSEAVRLAAPSIPAAGRARATGSEDSLDDAGRWIWLGAAAPHVGSLPRPSPRPPGWAAHTGPLPSVGGRGEMGRRGPSRWDLACDWGGLPGWRAAAWRRGCSCRIRGRFAHWAWRPAAGEAGAQDGGASRCQFGQAPTVEVGPSGRLVSRRGS